MSLLCASSLLTFVVVSRSSEIENGSVVRLQEMSAVSAEVLFATTAHSRPRGEDCSHRHRPGKKSSNCQRLLAICKAPNATHVELSRVVEAVERNSMR